MTMDKAELMRVARERLFPDAFEALATRPCDHEVEALCIEAVRLAQDEAVRQAALVCLAAHATRIGIDELVRIVDTAESGSTVVVAAFFLHNLDADAAVRALTKLRTSSRAFPLLEQALAGALAEPPLV